MSNQNIKDLNIIVIGNPKTGKTNYVNKLTKNTFNEEYKATIISDFGSKIFDKDGKLYKIQLWDLGGQDVKAMITKIFAKDCVGYIVLSDATNKQTREDTLKWKQNVDESATFLDGGKLPCILVESKIDLLLDKNENYEEEIKKFAKDNIFDDGFSVSSKEGKNINESFEFLMNRIIERLEIVLKSGKYMLGQDNELDIIKVKDLGQDKIEIYIIKNEDNKHKKYSCKINFKKLKKQNKVLNLVGNIENFINIIKVLNERNKIKTNFYLKNVIIQVGILFTSIFGEEEEITFELASEDMKKEDLVNNLIQELIKENNNINN